MAASFSETVDFTSVVNMGAATTVHHKAGSVTNAGLAVGPTQDYPFNFGLDTDATPVAKTGGGILCRAAGTIKYVYASLADEGSSTNVAFDCRKDGSTILSSAITFTHSDGARDHKAGTLAATTVAAGDTIDFDLAVTSSTGAQGPSMVIGIEWTATKS